MNASLLQSDRLQDPKTPPDEPTRRLAQPSDAWWRLYGMLKPYEAGDLVMLLKRIDPRCICLEYVHDNGDCPVHGPAPKPETDTPAAVLDHWFGPIDDAGTCFIVSGGEVLELGPHIPASDASDEELPF